MLKVQRAAHCGGKIKVDEESSCELQGYDSTPWLAGREIRLFMVEEWNAKTALLGFRLNNKINQPFSILVFKRLHDSPFNNHLKFPWKTKWVIEFFLYDGCNPFHFLGEVNRHFAPQGPNCTHVYSCFLATCSYEKTGTPPTVLPFITTQHLHGTQNPIW